MLRMSDTALIRWQAFINGDWMAAESGENLAVYNPATVAVAGTVAWIKE
jgi:succinate-semialdehyde dehydrogenase/glutarate-semialdehyde dehydrogenase